MHTLRVGENLTVFEAQEGFAVLVDDEGLKFELHTSPGYAETFERLYTELLAAYSHLEHRPGLKDRVDLVTRDERRMMAAALEAAKEYRELLNR